MNEYYGMDEFEQILEEHKQKTTKKCMIIAVIATILNLMLFFIFRANITGVIAGDISDDVKTAVSEDLTDEVLSQYKREFKINDSETTIGTYVYANASASVVEIYCESSGASSTATGMIVNSEGYVLTNAHVVYYEQQYRTGFTVATRNVLFSKVFIRLQGENDWRECSVVDYDTDKDLAIIKLKSVSGLTLQPIVYGDSDSLMIGEGAVIIGNAYGLGISVTTGTITNKNPKNLDDERDVIQTDTAINSGNSGGPVFDITGSCVGVATYKIVSNSNSSATTEGLGFALASNYATEYLTQNGVSFTSYTA